MPLRGATAGPVGHGTQTIVRRQVASGVSSAEEPVAAAEMGEAASEVVEPDAAIEPKDDEDEDGKGKDDAFNSW